MNKEPALALPVCDRSVALFPDDANLRDSRGVVRGLVGDLSGATTYLETEIGHLDFTSAERSARHSWLKELKRNSF